jgi:hypothetical protein
MGSGTPNACAGSSDGAWEASIPQRIVLGVLVEVWISIIENKTSTAAASPPSRGDQDPPVHHRLEPAEAPRDAKCFSGPRGQTFSDVNDGPLTGSN